MTAYVVITITTHARIITEALLERVYGIPRIDWARGEDLKKQQ
jgi:hypothetical protein